MKGRLFFCRYSQCIRQEAGYCCVQFQVKEKLHNSTIIYKWLPKNSQACTDANSFTIDATIAAAGTSLVDTQCTLDYITIPSKKISQNCRK